MLSRAGGLAEARRDPGLFGLLARARGGEAVVEAFLAGRSDFEADHIEAGALPAEIPVEGNRIRILPGLYAAAGGADGFFIARFRRL
jgi:16S rRNA C967 or C1407 C5-methylase (RsmB/RsmF family)